MTAPAKSAAEVSADARGLRIAVLHAAFNAPVVSGLVAGARAALAEMGAQDALVQMVELPGAFELPVAALAAARSGRFDCVIALGAVIKGDTDHYEHVARAAAEGLLRASLETGIPVAFGVLTCATAEQAAARSRPGPENKGGEAARAAIATARALERLR